MWKIEEQIKKIHRGNQKILRFSLTALLARGHLLLEGLPGVGKTTLAVALARTLGCTFQRIQFTSDLLPSDIIGYTILDQVTRRLTFRPGPIFHNVILADEVNRATPRTQSALLEAMGEAQVSIEGETRPLPRPFLVIATQNPMDHHGTFPLPDSQLDRFLMKLSLTYPSVDQEKSVLLDGKLREKAELLKPLTDPEGVLEMQNQAEMVKTDEAIVSYILEILLATRRHSDLLYGISTRGGLYLLRAARAYAYLEGRDYVVPDDVKAVGPYVISHRLRTKSEKRRVEDIMTEILEEVPVPL